MSRRLAKLGDGTTSGGQIVSATSGFSEGAIKLVLDGDKALCPKCRDSFPVVGTAIYFSSGSDRHVADGDKVLCRCPDNVVVASTTYWVEKAGARAQALQAVSSPEPAQYAQTAKARTAPAAVEKVPPEPLPLPARIYTTQRVMDDYGAKDMHYGDLSEEELKGRFGLTDVSAKVNPYTLTLSPPAPASPYEGFYPVSLTENAPVVVSREESARLMFDEFRELAKVYSFHGPYKNIINEMINHMQENHGAPYRSPLLDKALKEQILNDRSEQSSLLRIKTVLNKDINYEYGFIPLDKKADLFDEKGNFKDLSRTVLPKFDSQIDKTNGLVITVHDTWATHITLVSLQVSGNSYRATVHYRVQDHFGLDDDDILNPVYREARIFRIWFVLQRCVKYGYRPFITEMNATVEISGRRGE